MKDVKQLLEMVTGKLEGLARGNAVVAKPISVGKRHVIPLCELSFGFGAGGGVGEGAEGDSGGKGLGGGAGAGVKATPVAVVVIDGGKARVESLGS